MLQTGAVEPATLSLLKDLLSIDELQEFYLVGGTALALKFDHRKSIDLDLFTTGSPDMTLLRKVLERKFGNSFEGENREIKFRVFCSIHSVKVDIVNIPQEMIRKPELIDGIRMYSNEDIAAMKINALLDRGQKKDFYDVCELLKIFTLGEIIAFYREKYSDQHLLISIPSAITYFSEAEESPDPVSLNGTTWENVQEKLKEEVRNFLR